jgi:hypothetical protein
MIDFVKDDGGWPPNSRLKFDWNGESWVALAVEVLFILGETEALAEPVAPRKTQSDELQQAAKGRFGSHRRQTRFSRSAPRVIRFHV